jgi:hypothetical protein
MTVPKISNGNSRDTGDETTGRPLFCDICGIVLPKLYCSSNICVDCCRKGRCPADSWCKEKSMVVR